MGNLIASETKERAYESVQAGRFYQLLAVYVHGDLPAVSGRAFVAIWLGQDFVLTKAILILAVAIYYFKGINSGIDIAKNAAGLYYPDRFIPMAEALQTW